MKFVIEKNKILEGLVNVTKAISSRNIIPILNGIKFDLNNEGLYLTASNGELTIRHFIESKEITNIENEGIIVIQSKFIVDIIRKMPTNEINFEVIDGLKIKISSGSSEYNLNCLDPSDYPTIKLEENKNPIIMDTSLLKDVINETGFAISTQELRPLLTGINFKISGNVMECIATDSYRLAMKSIKLDNSIEESYNLVIPGKNILELDKIINDEKVELHIFNNKVLFKYKNIFFQTNLLSGTYPNTQNLIPTEFKIMLNTNLNEYYSAIDRAALLTDNRDKNIVKMHLEKNELTILSTTNELGKVEEKVTVDSTSSESLDISFSARYMMEALKTFKDDDIMILLNEDVKPIVIKSVKDESLIQLILPIKTY